MCYVREHRVPMSTNQFVKDLKEKSLDPKAVCVTFDDGYLDNVEYALPILEKYEIPATVYVAPRLLCEVGLAWWYELEARLAEVKSLKIMIGESKHNFDLKNKKYEALTTLNELCKVSKRDQICDILNQMQEQGAYIPANWQSPPMLCREQISELAKHPLIELGGHTDSHVCLAVLSEGEAHSEVNQGRQSIEEWSGRRIKTFAYPFGGSAQAGSREARMVETCGFDAAFTTLIGHVLPSVLGIFRKGPLLYNEDLFLLPRISVGGQDSFKEFLWKLEGGHMVWDQILRTVKGKR
jgi:peptidoglycan/xylan/chitin deacetylase (PgdA/CDA1 family)